MRRLGSLVAAVLLAVLLAGRGAEAQTLVADLSEHEIKITTGFSGTELLLFGAKEGPGDIVVIVSGPETPVTVRKKSRVSGVWINTDSVRFDTVPGFYRVAATPGLAEPELQQFLRETGLSSRYLKLHPAGDVSPEQATAFREALLRRKEARGLYSRAADPIEIVGGALFRTRVPFPATVPTGAYQVDVYYVVDGWVNSTTSIPLTVSKGGMEASIFRFAHEFPSMYGVFAILVAVVAGYGAGMLFGRR